MRLFNTSVLLLSAMVLAAFVLGCSSESETVKIGLLAPQTGPIAQYAPGFEDAANIRDQIEVLQKSYLGFEKTETG